MSVETKHEDGFQLGRALQLLLKTAEADGELLTIMWHPRKGWLVEFADVHGDNIAHVCKQSTLTEAADYILGVDA